MAFMLIFSDAARVLYARGALIRALDAHMYATYVAKKNQASPTAYGPSDHAGFYLCGGVDCGRWADR